MSIEIGTPVKVKEGHPFGGQKGVVKAWHDKDGGVAVVILGGYRGDSVPIMKDHLEEIKI